MNKNRNLKTLVAAALFSALTVLATMILKLPVLSNGGYIHLGDSIIYLAACLLPAPLACISAAIGGGLADILGGAALWAGPTIVIKALIALCFSRAGEIVCRRNIIALIIAALITIIGYYLAEAFLFGSFTAPLVSVGGNAVQAAANSVLFLALGAAVERTQIKNALR